MGEHYTVVFSTSELILMNGGVVLTTRAAAVRATIPSDALPGAKCSHQSPTYQEHAYRAWEQAAKAEAAAAAASLR